MNREEEMRRTAIEFLLLETMFTHVVIVEEGEDQRWYFCKALGDWASGHYEQTGQGSTPALAIMNCAIRAGWKE